MNRRLFPLLLALAVGCPTGEPPPEDTFHDPLSRPAEPTLDPSDFAASADCVGCHPDQVAQWETSSHAYAMVDPVFRALVEIRQDDFAGAQDPFCTQCHSAIGTRGGEIVDGFHWSDLSEVTLEGVTCTACHSVSHLERASNSGHVLDPGGPLRGPFTDPEPSSAHESVGTDLLGTASFCGGCHDVVELDGLNLERPFAEWQESPAAEEGRPCQTCHMPTSTGPATNQGTRDRTLRSHRFVGVDLPLLEDFLTPEQELQKLVEAEQLLATAATLLVEPGPFVPGEQLDLYVTVQNDIDAHNLPTGSTFIRQLWVELTARDVEGTVLYRTGDLDAAGDLRDHWSELDPYGDQDLLSFASNLVDEAGNPELFPWRAAEHTSASLAPLYARTATLFVPTAGATAGPVTVEARLRFRPYPPHLLRALGLEDAISRVPIIDLDAVTLEVPAP